jgi:hypothetical protein
MPLICPSSILSCNSLFSSHTHTRTHTHAHKLTHTTTCPSSLSSLEMPSQKCLDLKAGTAAWLQKPAWPLACFDPVQVKGCVCVCVCVCVFTCVHACRCAAISCMSCVHACTFCCESTCKLHFVPLRDPHINPAHVSRFVQDHIYAQRMRLPVWYALAKHHM